MTGGFDAHEFLPFHFEIADRFQKLFLRVHQFFVGEPKLKQELTGRDGFAGDRVNLCDVAGQTGAYRQQRPAGALDHHRRHLNAPHESRFFQRLEELVRQTKIRLRFRRKFQRSLVGMGMLGGVVVPGMSLRGEELPPRRDRGRLQRVQNPWKYLTSALAPSSDRGRPRPG